MNFYQAINKNSSKDKQSNKLYPDLSEKQENQSKSKGSKINEKKTFNRQNQSKLQGGRQGDLRNSVFLKNKEEENEQGWIAKCCACTKLEYYKEYFKVTSSQVKRRIANNLKFWDGGFFSPQDQDYDFYGPFWIYTTVVFLLGAVHNILQYQASDYYQYDYSILGQAFFIMYVLGFGLPIGVNTTVIQIVCLYGYSMPIYIVCIALCSINFCLLHWIFLGYGAANKIYFVFKNIHEGFQIPVSKKLLMTILIVVEGVLQFLLFKFRFIQCPDYVSSAEQGESHMLGAYLVNGQSENFMHFRNFRHEQIFGFFSQRY